MESKIGDKVKMISQHHARAWGVWEMTGEVTEIVEVGTSVKRVTVKFPGVDPIVGMVAGQFEMV